MASKSRKSPKVSFLDRFDPEGTIRETLRSYEDSLASSPPAREADQIKVKLEKMRAAILQLNEWESIAETVGRRGWCFYHRSNVPVYKQAAMSIQTGDSDVADEVLCQYWNDNDYLFKWGQKLRRLYYVDDDFLEGECKNGVIVFRHKILDEAVALFREKRYEAAIPLVISQLDGICLDSTGGLIGEVRPKKFFGSSSTHLEDALTFAGHHNCLKLIKEILSTNVAETNTYDSPYRHGIMHGRTLGYGTRTNALKFFVALDAFMYFSHKRVWRVCDQREHTNV